jgi:uncharacterized protein GlcG (DUF336 family)
MHDSLTLDLALQITQATLAKGREIGCKPLTVAVLDAGGHLLALLREDGASNMRPQLAIGKASGALALGVSSRKIATMAEERPHFINALATLSVGGLIPAAGGILLQSCAARIIGAVGVTGDTSDRDELCGLHGIAAVGLRAFE